MAWFRCPCGHEAQVTPRDVYEVVSVYHLHARARVGGGTEPVRMEEVPVPVSAPAPEPALAGTR
jgi:hypothetical protein